APVTVGANVTLTETDLPTGTVGTPYSQALPPAGSTFALRVGQLPPGLSLSPEGLLSGTPTANGSFTFTVEVTDANQRFDARTFTVAINPPLGGTGPATLSGLVFQTVDSVDPDQTMPGAGVAGVRVTAEGANTGTMMSATTGANGTYSFGNLPADTYQV